MTTPAGELPPLRSPQSTRNRAHVFARASLVLVGLSPWLLPLVCASVPLGAVGDWLGLPFALVCHRRPERTLLLLGVAMPVCSRCAGIFAGAAVGALFAWPRVELRRGRIALGVAVFLTALDVLLQDAGVHPVWHSSRLATGALLGYVAALTLTSILAREAGA